MKNIDLRIIAGICLACICFTAGLFVGRNINHAQIQVSHTPTVNRMDTETPDPPQIFTEKININTASVDSLELLPGIGLSLAQSIVDYRAEHGHFSSVTDLLNIPGIGQTRLEAIIEYITVGG